MSTPTALEALPPSVGDAPVAAVLLRDVVADLLAADRPGGVVPAAVDVDDDGRFHLRAVPTKGSATDLEHAPYAAPELFHGAMPDGRTDVYAAACLALTRFLGTPPVPAPALGHRPTAAVRLGALRQAQQTSPARLGAMPDPFRPLFARAVAKERHLRPTPAALLADLDAAIAAVGGEAAVRTRVHRLIVLARVFEPGAGSNLRKPPVAEAAVASAPLHLPIRSLPALRPSRRATRVALIAAVTVVATGGVAVAAVVGLSNSTPRPRPQAIETLTSPSPSTSRSASPSAVATTSSAAPAPGTTAAPVEVAPVGGNGGSTSGRGSGSGSGNGSGNGGSGNGGSGSGSSGRGGSGGSGGSGSGSGGGANTPAPPPPAPPASPPPVVESPPYTPPSDPPTTSRPTVSGTPTVGPTTSSPAATTAQPSATPTSSDGG